MLSEIEAITIAVSAGNGAKSESDQLNVVIDQFFRNVPFSKEDKSTPVCIPSSLSIETACQGE